MKILLSTAYFPPIQYFTKFIGADEVFIERHENFCKQSYRNRCTILTANGLLDLVVPVVRGEKVKTPIAELRLAYDSDWQKMHFKAIESAYRRSPFYDFYIDDLMPFFTRRYSLLYDLNRQILTTLGLLTGVAVSFLESEVYEAQPVNTKDFRNAIHPKPQRRQPDPEFKPQPYTQVFADRFDFQANLSILDMLFNVGPECVKMLQ